METDFGFDEYIMPTTYAEMPKLESYDAQLYPSDGMGYVCDPNVMTNTTVPLAIPHHHHHHHHQPVLTLDHQQQPLLPSSPDESVHSRQLSPPATTPPLLSCSPTSTSGTSMSQASPITMATATMTSPGVPTAHHVISEKIAQVNKLPESFLPEFHQYSKETYENGASNNKKRRRLHKEEGNENDPQNSSDQEDDIDSVSAAELRRQIHIQSEQKRRAQIKDGFDELRQHLPGCVNKKMSKAALLHRTVQHLQHLKSTQGALLAELERLVNENEQLRKFQESVLHKQALDRMYQMAPM